MTTTLTSKSTLIWDLPVRICHWLMVLLVISQWVTAEILDDAIQWHAWFGYGLLGIVLFRLIWGFIGTRYARYGSFIVSPRKTFVYLRQTISGTAPTYTGHNPLGGWMALFLLLLLAAQAITGLFMTDDIFFFAPYYSAVSSTVQEWMNTLHHQLFTVLQFAIGAHIAAALVYVFINKQPLIQAMITGKKKVAENEEIAGSKWPLAFVIALIVGVLLYLVITVWAPVPEDIWSY